VALLACVAVAACAGANNSSTTASISNIEIGMTESQVLSIMVSRKSVKPTVAPVF